MMTDLEEGCACCELGDDTPTTPDIHGFTIGSGASQ